MVNLETKVANRGMKPTTLLLVRSSISDVVPNGLETIIASDVFEAVDTERGSNVPINDVPNLIEAQLWTMTTGT